jgi:rubrerythrin
MAGSREEAAKVFEDALKLEMEGFNFYRECAKCAKTEDGRKTFDHLAQEERKHFDIISRMFEMALFDEYVAFRESDTGGYEESGVFSSFDFSRVGNSGEDARVLDYGIESEKKSIRLYTIMAQQAFYPDVQDVAAKLISEETLHLLLLRSMREKLG